MAISRREPPIRRRRAPSGLTGTANGAATVASAGAEVAPQPATAANASRDRDGLPRVTGVRHWSTPDYTRVAIDVEQEVKFGSQRIAHPDRIFFDLRDTKLASTLVGKTFDVDDGFLKKIRVAEFQPGRTRIVLEVDDLASYDAFLLPDPYRLIIDIHGKGVRGQQRQAKVVSADLSKTDLANARPALDPPVVASPESDDGSNIAAAVEESPPRNSRAKSQNSKVDDLKSGPVETDLPAKAVAANSEPPDSAQPANGIGVIKTTVAVKGSSRRIPKTIVEAEDRVPSKVAKFDRKKLRFEKTPEEATAAETDEATTPRSSSGNSASGNSARRRTSRSSTSDLAGLDATREARPTAGGDRSLIPCAGTEDWQDRH